MFDWLLDRSIFWSFDRSGYERHSQDFTPIDADLRGKVFAVTGANSGLGFATCIELARMGATVRMLCRSEERGRKAQEEIRQTTGNMNVHLDLVDVSDGDSIRAFVDGFEVSSLHGLVHNAGVLLNDRRENAEGHELTYATNALGGFRLTAALYPKMEAGGRLIFVASGGLYGVRFDPHLLTHGGAKKYDGVKAYAQTKHAQVIMAEHFAEKLPHLEVSVMHPGWAETPGVESSLPGFFSKMEGRLRSPAQGADTIVWLAASDEAAGTRGRFYFDRTPVEPQLWFRRPTTNADKKRLWTLLCKDSDLPVDFMKDSQ